MFVRRFRTPAAGRVRRTSVGVAGLALAAGLLSACDSPVSEALPDEEPSAAEEAGSAPAPFRLRSNVSGRTPVAVDTAVELTARCGSLRNVRVVSGAGPLPGRLVDGGSPHC